MRTVHYTFVCGRACVREWRFTIKYIFACNASTRQHRAKRRIDGTHRGEQHYKQKDVSTVGTEGRKREVTK